MSALLIVDVQNDFLPGGALAVPDSDAILPVISRLIAAAPLVIATQDWHPKGHVSFASTHGKDVGDVVDGQHLWPDHCIQGAFGAELSGALDQTRISYFVKKGCDPLVDSYSAFFDNAAIHKTDLDDYLQKRAYASSSSWGSLQIIASILQRSMLLNSVTK